VKENAPDEIAYVVLKPHEKGDFYSVSSATFARKKYIQNKELLWEGAPDLHPGDGTPNALDSGQSNKNVTPSDREVKSDLRHVLGDPNRPLVEVSKEKVDRRFKEI
jgi:hypothetical protein